MQTMKQFDNLADYAYHANSIFLPADLLRLSPRANSHRQESTQFLRKNGDLLGRRIEAILRVRLLFFPFLSLILSRLIRLPSVV